MTETTTTAAASWREFADEAPELAWKVRARFEATKHHVLATLRTDGSPRVSGTEVAFMDDGLHLGSMPDAIKARDLQRDGHFAIHANPGDGSMEGGDAKVSGIAVEIVDPEEVERSRSEGTPPGPFHLFRLLLTDAVLTELADDRLRISHWRPGAGPRETFRG